METTASATVYGNLVHSRSDCDAQMSATLLVMSLRCVLQLQLQDQEQHVSPGGHRVDSLPVMPCLQLRLQQPLTAAGSLNGQRSR